MATGDEAGTSGRAEGSRAFLEAEAAALSLLEAAEAQQGMAKEQILAAQTATRQLFLQQTELAKVAMAIEQSHKGYREAIDQAIARFQQSIQEADATVSGYVVAALERHQEAFSKALQEAVEKSVAQVQQVTEGAAKETLSGLQQAAKAGQLYADGAKRGVKAFRDRQLLLCLLAFFGGALLVIATGVAVWVMTDDGGRLARANQLEGRIQVLQRQHDELQQEIDAKRGSGNRAAPRPAR